MSLVPFLQQRSRSVAMALTAVVSVSLLAYGLSRLNLEALAKIFRDAALLPLTLAALAFSVGLLLGALRLRLMLKAFAADNIPPFASLIRFTCLGFFYNTVLPGGIGGDIVRSVLLRNAFADRGAARAGGIAFLERIFGVSALVFVAALLRLVVPLPGLHIDPLLFAFALVAALSVLPIAFAVKAYGSRHSSLTGAPFGEARRTAALPLAAAMAVSVLNHLLIAVVGVLLFASVAPNAPVLDSLRGGSLLPLAAAAAFLPFTWAGAGAREVAVVGLARVAGLSEESAFAVSILFGGIQFVTAALAGLGAWCLRNRWSELPLVSQTTTSRLCLGEPT